MTYPHIPHLRLGTSSWSSEDWVGTFYPPGTTPADFLGAYAQHFDTVEVDSTYYRIPSESMVRNWRARTPPGFTFAAKFPQVITHEKVLQDCREELADFLRAMSLLEDRLGPLLLQFPYFNKKAFARPEDFLARLTPFLEELPGGFQLRPGGPQQVLGECAVARYPAQEGRGPGADRSSLDDSHFATGEQAGSWSPRTSPTSAGSATAKALRKKPSTGIASSLTGKSEMRIWIPIIRQILKRRHSGDGIFQQSLRRLRARDRSNCSARSGRA